MLARAIRTGTLALVGARVLVVIAIAIAGLGVAGSRACAQAEAPRATLRYESPDASCPDEQSLRDAVAARLGRDPFADDAEMTIEARIARVGRRYEGAIRVLDRDGAVRGERRVAAAEPDCEELGRALALAISVAIDPLSLTRPTVSETETEAETEAETETETEVDAEAEADARPEATRCPEPPPAAAPEPRAPVRAEIGLGVHAALEAAPAPTVGGALSVGMRIEEIVSIALEARLDAPQGIIAADRDRGRAAAHFVGGVLVPCGHVWLVALCGIASVGALRGQGSDVDLPRSDASLFAMIGGRVAIDAPFERWIALRVLADVQATLTPTTLDLDDRVVYDMPAASFTLGARVLFLVP